MKRHTYIRVFQLHLIFLYTKMIDTYDNALYAMQIFTAISKEKTKKMKQND